MRLLRIALLPVVLSLAAGVGAAQDKAPPQPKDRAPEKQEKAQVVRRVARTKAEALAILEQVRVSVNYDAVPLRDAVTHLSAVTGVNMVIGPALIKEGDLDARKVTLRLQKLPASEVLALMTDSLGLGIGFQGGVLLVTTVKEARGKPVLRLYAIGDLAMPIRDFPAPDLMLHPAGAEVEKEPETERKGAFSEPEDVLAMIKDHTGTGTWSDEEVSASVMKEWLVVKQYPDVHQEIAHLLQMLRAAR